MTAKTCFLGLFVNLFVCLMAPAADVRGVVLKVDADKNQVTIEGRGLGVRGAIMIIQLDKNTQIQAGGKSASVADLAAGTRVRVTYDVQGEQRVALRINFLGAPPSSPPPPPPAPAAPAGGSANGISGTLRRVSFTERE